MARAGDGGVARVAGAITDAWEASHAFFVSPMERVAPCDALGTAVLPCVLACTTEFVLRSMEKKRPWQDPWTRVLAAK